MRNDFSKLTNRLNKITKAFDDFQDDVGDLIVRVPTLRFKPGADNFKKALTAIGEKVNGPNVAQKLADRIDEVLKEAIKAKIWESNDGVDDILETGALLNSQEVTISGSEIIVSYTEPYAALIHYGGYILPYGNENARKVYIPPRPWIEATLNNETGRFNLNEETAKALLELLK